MSEEMDYTESKAKAEEAQILWHEFRETMLKELVPNMSKKEAKKLLENLFKNDAYLGARVYEESGGVGTYTAEVAYLYYTFVEEDTKKLYETFVLNK